MKTRALLCVDDDLGILEFYETLLASEGYAALLARDAHQALQLFDSRKDEISVVMSDFSMPEMNSLAAKLKRRDPSVPVILISGCQPVLPENHRVDASLSKGASLETILNQIKALVNPNGTGQVAVTKAAAAAGT